MELFHVLNRGVDGRDIFIENRDYLRFVHNLYEFNDSTAADNNIGFHFKHRDIVSPYVPRSRNLLVDIHGWVLMKNHYHLLLSERVEGGISLFLRKLNVGYAKYLNERLGRTGTLFQGRTKKILIDHTAHFLYILHYIHFNPLDYLSGAEKWRVRSKGALRNTEKALEYLDSYRWSSYLDYTGVKNFPSILMTSFFRESLGDIRAESNAYLHDAEYDAASIKLTLE